MDKQDLEAEKLDAQLREADAKLDALQAQADARKAKEDMTAIASLRDAKVHAQEMLADMKQAAVETLDTSRRAVQSAVHELEVGIERVNERLTAWDEARERRFNATLDEAGAKLRRWKARFDQKQAELEIEGHDAIASLQERIALARARFAEWNQARHNREAQEALEEEARRLNDAFDAAAKRYDK